MGRLFDIIMRIVTIIAMIGLLGSYTAPYINPNVFYFSSLLGYTYHYLLIVNIILLLYWIACWKKIAILSILIIAAGYPLITTYYGLNPQTVPDAPHNLSIMTYNIQMLGIGEKDAPAKIENYINNSGNDIVCMQEFPQREASFKKFPAYPYYHRNRDVALVSRYPIINKGVIKFDKGHSAACV